MITGNILNHSDTLSSSFQFGKMRYILSSFLLGSFSDPSIIDSLPAYFQNHKVEFADALHSLPDEIVERIYSIYLKNEQEKKLKIFKYIDRILKSRYRNCLPAVCVSDRIVPSGSIHSNADFISCLTRQSHVETVDFDLEVYINYLFGIATGTNPLFLLDYSFKNRLLMLCEALDDLGFTTLSDIGVDTFQKIAKIEDLLNNTNVAEWNLFSKEIVQILDKLRNLKQFLALRSKKNKRHQGAALNKSGFWSMTKKMFQKAAVFCLTAGISVSIYADICRDISQIRNLNSSLPLQDSSRNLATSSRLTELSLEILNKFDQRKTSGNPSTVSFTLSDQILESPIDRSYLETCSASVRSFPAKVERFLHQGSDYVNFITDRFQDYLDEEPAGEFCDNPAPSAPDVPKLSVISKFYFEKSISKKSTLLGKKRFNLQLDPQILDKDEFIVAQKNLDIVKNDLAKNHSSQIYIGFWKNSRSRFKNHTATHVGYLIFNNGSIDVLHAKGNRIVLESISNLDTYKLKTVIALDITKSQAEKFSSVTAKYRSKSRYYQQDRCARFVWKIAKDCGFEVPQNDAWNQRTWYLKSVNTDLNGSKSPKYEILYDFIISKKELKKTPHLLSCNNTDRKAAYFN